MSRFAFCTLLLAAQVQAWPVDWIHDVEAGKEKFVKLPQLDWFEVDEPGVLDVAWQADSEELLLVGLKAGRATVLLGANGKVAAWRVRVGTPPLRDEAAIKEAHKACPSLKLTPLEDVKLTVTAQSEACHAALLKLFQTDIVEARALELTYEGTVLQQQLKRLQTAFGAIAKGRVSARYVGAGLVLDGRVSEAEHRKLLWEVLKKSLGRFALDDQLELITPDAGTPR